MKKVIKVVAVLAVLLVAVVLVAFLMVNSIVRTAVQTAGHSATGSETTLGGVDVGLVGGTASIQDFALAQPEGFTGESIFALDAADVEIESGSLLSDTIVVPKVHIDGAHLTVSFEDGKLNLNELRKAIAERTGTTEETAEDDAAGKNVVIRDLKITNTKVTGAVSLIPGQDPVSIDLVIADIEKQNLGSDGSGLKLDDVIGLVLDTVALNATQGIADKVPGLADIGNLIGGVGEQATEALDQVGDEATEAVGGAIDDAGKKLEEGLGGLLGGNKKDE